MTVCSVNAEACPYASNTGDCSMLEWPAVWRAHGSFPDAVVVTDWLDFDLVLDALVPGLDDEPHMRHTVFPPRASAPSVPLCTAPFPSPLRRSIQAPRHLVLHFPAPKSVLSPESSCLLLSPPASRLLVPVSLAPAVGGCGIIWQVLHARARVRVHTLHMAGAARAVPRWA
jgi:hypothetical protein